MSQDEINDSELQKAIDDINKTTSVDPVFSDPVAAPSTVPEGEQPGSLEPVGPFPEVQPMPEIQMPVAQEQPQMPSVPPVQPQPMPQPEMQVPSMTGEGNMGMAQMNLHDIKKSALKELMPLMNRMRINPSQKFRICKEAIEILRDRDALESAYDAAMEITDENEKGEALIYLVEVIDRL